MSLTGTLHRRLLRLAALCLTTLAVGGSASAQPLTLEAVLASTDRSAPQVLAALQQLEGARGEQLAQRGGFDPTLKGRANVIPLGGYQYRTADVTLEQPTPLWGSQLLAGWRYGQGDLPAYYGGQQTLDAGELRVGAQVPLWRDGPTDRRRTSIERSVLGTRAAAAALDARRNDLRRAATQRYWEWVAAGRRLTLAEALLELARARDAGLRSRVARGDLADIEQLENERALLQREERVVAARRSVEAAGLELSLYLRDEAGRPVRPATARLPDSFGPVPEALPTLESAVGDARARRPELARLRLVREQGEVELRWADNQFSPRIDLSAVLSRDVGSAQCADSLCDPSVPTAGVFAKSKPELNVGLQLELPLLFRGARGRLESQRAAVAVAQADLDLQADRIGTEVQDALEAVRAARQRLDLAQRQVAVATRLEDAERRRFTAGESTLLIVNLREQATFEAANTAVDAHQALLKALADWRWATAEGLPQTPAEGV